MANSTGRKRRKTVNKTTGKRTKTNKDFKLEEEITVFLLLALFVFLFICNFHIAGTVGDFISGVQFGLFGLLSYLAPIAAFFIIVYKLVNPKNRTVTLKTVFSVILFFLFSMVAELILGISGSLDSYNFAEIYEYGKESSRGGGVVAGSLVYFLGNSIGKAGTIVFIVVMIIISLIVLTEKSFVESIKNTEEKLSNIKNSEDSEARAEFYRVRQEENERKRALKKERAIELKKEKEAKSVQKEDDKVLRRNKKAVGITDATTLVETSTTVATGGKSGDMHEINLDGFDPASEEYIAPVKKPAESHPVTINKPAENDFITIYEPEKIESPAVEQPRLINEGTASNNQTVDKSKTEKPSEKMQVTLTTPDNSGKYKFPPISMLKKSSGKRKAESEDSLRETAYKLQKTLETFGVKATVTEITQGPTVTRFELQPELGVKVSRIKSLSDDIKLNLAAADIRIEAPIPGKAAIGIEIPNKNNQPVLLGDLIDSADFKQSHSNLSFAVGKDIAGKNIIYDIDKFPHLLIAGATGSGKSVCINTIIMSIIYKAHPNDVKLIMIDPKVVELSVYNGIPHLLLPVVSDPKKAAATLNFAVNEMMERYKKFADLNTRDLDGYNRAVEEQGESEINKKLPRIVIIVDELADLIMVAKNEVEDSICRLAQLARAAGIHLIIATQRPSVDVITGLIKANMPSRIAFAVSSGVDSRTILDMNGAEELLGKGDMLFFPKGLKKPVRLQGGFVSDTEVNEIVDYLRGTSQPTYDANIEEKIESMKSSSGGSAASSDSGNGYDDMFIEAGRFVITSNKASIGNMQRKFKMGFNRAARIMDELCEAGVVGPDEGTKPRQIYMNLEAFENYIENNM